MNYYIFYDVDGLHVALKRKRERLMSMACMNNSNEFMSGMNDVNGLHE